MLLNQIKFPFTAFLMAVLVVAPLPTNAGQRFDIPDPSQWRVQPPTKAMKKTLTKLTLGLEVLYNEYHDYQVSKAQAMRQGKAVAAFASKRTMAHLISENVVVDMTASAAPELLRQDLLGLGANSISVYGQRTHGATGRVGATGHGKNRQACFVHEVCRLGDFARRCGHVRRQRPRFI